MSTARVPTDGTAHDPVRRVSRRERARRVPGRARFDRAQFRARMVIVFCLALVCFLLPAAGAHRTQVALLLVLVVAPSHLVIRRLSGVPNPTGWLDLVAVGAASISAAVEPAIWAPCLLFQLLTVGGAVAFLRPRWTVTLGATALGSMALVALTRHVDGAIGMLAVGIVFVPVLMAGSFRKQAREQRASHRMDAAIGSLPIAVWEADATTGQLLGIVGRLDDLLGRSTDDVIARGLIDDVHADDRAAFVARFGDRRARRAIPMQHELEYRYHRPDGTWVWLRDRVTRVDIGRSTIVRGVTVDVTTNHDQQLGLRRQQQIVERMGAMTVVVAEDANGEPKVLQLTDPIGWGAPSDASGRDLDAVLPAIAGRPELAAALNGGDRRDADRLGPWDVVDARGQRRVVEVEAFAINGGATAMLVSDVTERERLAGLMRHQARHDDLTGLANRASLLEQAEAVTADGRAGALLLIDLNEFKAVNDTLGHLTGDHYLRVIARRLTQMVGPGEHVARLGGDEFAVLLADPDPCRVDELAAAIVRRFREPVTLRGVAIAGSASVGIAWAPKDADTAEALLRCADVAMYRAKSTNAGACCYLPEMNRTADQLRLMGDLGRAFSDHQFETYFQPKMSLKTGAIVGAEALVRWNHPDHGVLAPATFLDLVALAGFADDLASTTVQQAVDALALLPTSMEVAVNLTAQNIRSPLLPAACRARLHAAGVDPSRLTVEITESHMLDTSGVVRSVVCDLAAAGVGVAVDDFGTGYSSLVHLRSLPLSELKIDQRFVRSMIVEQQDHAIVRSMIDLGHSLGLTVTAEGVEEQQVAERLGQLRCDSAQGYFYGHATPLGHFRELLDAGAVRSANPA